MDEAASSLKACAQCGRSVTPVDRVDTADRSFCRTCYDQLQSELHEVARQSSRDIPYPAAFTGAVLGGILGALVWWGFTVITSVALGLIAIAIGFLVGHGAVRFSGGKKSREMQIMCVAVALVSILAATYLVNMTFINQAFEKQGEAQRLAFPSSLDIFFRVIALNFGIMDVVFIAITLWEAWKIPAPLTIPPSKLA